VEGRGRPEGEPRGKARVRTQRRVALPPNLARVNEAARKEKSLRFTALLHHLDVAALERAFRRLKRGAAAGVDGETVATYQQGLQQRLRDLCDRVHSGRYRPRPVRRVYMAGFYEEVRRRWYRVLKRRSQRALTWKRFNVLLERFPLPAPHISHPRAAPVVA